MLCVCYSLKSNYWFLLLVAYRSLVKALAGLHFAKGQLIPVVTAIKGLLYVLCFVWKIFTWLHNASPKSGEHELHDYLLVHSPIDGHVHVSSAGTGVMKLLERYLLCAFLHLAESPHRVRRQEGKMKSALSIKSLWDVRSKQAVYLFFFFSFLRMDAVSVFEQRRC